MAPKAWSALLTLKTFPYRCPPAPENDQFDFTVRMRRIVDNCLFTYTVDEETQLPPAEAGGFESFVSYGLKSFTHESKGKTVTRRVSEGSRQPCFPSLTQRVMKSAQLQNLRVGLRFPARSEFL